MTEAGLREVWVHFLVDGYQGNNYSMTKDKDKYPHEMNRGNIRDINKLLSLRDYQFDQHILTLLQKVFNVFI